MTSTFNREQLVDPGPFEMTWTVEPQSNILQHQLMPARWATSTGEVSVLNNGQWNKAEARARNMREATQIAIAHLFELEMFSFQRSVDGERGHS